jgi:hypothetical protein
VIAKTDFHIETKLRPLTMNRGTPDHRQLMLLGFFIG